MATSPNRCFNHPDFYSVVSVEGLPVCEACRIRYYEEQNDWQLNGRHPFLDDMRHRRWITEQQTIEPSFIIQDCFNHPGQKAVVTAAHIPVCESCYEHYRKEAYEALNIPFSSQVSARPFYENLRARWTVAKNNVISSVEVEKIVLMGSGRGKARLLCDNSLDVDPASGKRMVGLWTGSGLECYLETTQMETEEPVFISSKWLKVFAYNTTLSGPKSQYEGLKGCYFNELTWSHPDNVYHYQVKTGTTAAKPINDGLLNGFSTDDKENYDLMDDKENYDLILPKWPRKVKEKVKTKKKLIASVKVKEALAERRLALDKDI